MNAQIIKNRLRKVFAYSVTGLIFLILSSFLLLQAPPVQQKLIDRYLGELQEVTGFPTTIKSFKMLWFDRLELENLLIEDTEQNKMIAVERLRINFKLFEMLRGKYVNIDGIVVDKADVFLNNIQETDSTDDLNINIFIDRINKKYGGKGSGGASPVINVGEAILQNSSFRYNDGSTDTLSGFDYHRFTIDITDVSLDKFMIVGDTIEFDVASIVAKDRQTQLRVNSFSTFFRISQKAMEFYNLKADIGKSYIADTIVFLYESQRDLNRFNDAVKIQAHLEKIKLHPQDLELFAKGASKLDLPLEVSGNFNGKVKKFVLSDMLLQTGNSELRGELSMDGLPYIDETFIEIDLENSNLRFEDLSFALNNEVIEKLSPLGATNLKGQFLGYVSDFVANASIQTRLGNIKSDINLKINESNNERSTYSGNLSLINFDLGTYLNDTTNFQKVSLAGKIKGSGLTISTADFLLNANVSSIGIRNYNYQNIYTDARFAKEFFSGKIGVDDAHAKINLVGSLDLRKGINEIKMQGKIDTLDFHKIMLSKEVLSLSTEINIDTKGFELDSLIGSAVFKNAKIHYKERSLALQSVDVFAAREKELHELSVRTDLISASAKGNFNFSDLFIDLQGLVTELNLNIRNDSLRIAEYYKSERRSLKDYAVSLEVLIKDATPVATLLDINFSLSPNVNIEGSFTKGITTIFNAYSKIPKLQYDNFIFENTNIDINTSKLKDSTAVLAMAFIQSDKQSLEGIATKDLITEVIWNKNHIDFNLDLDQEKLNNNVRLRGTVDFKDSIYIRLQNSTFQLLDKTWKVNEETLVSQKGSDWHLEQVGFFQDEQRINLQGMISNKKDEPLFVSLRNIDLNGFESIISEKLSGLVNADLTFRDLYNEPTLENKVDVRNLTVNDFLVGDIIGNNQWNSEENKFVVDFMVNRMGIEAINLKGYYDPTNKVSPLNVLAVLNQANLKLAEPILRGIFSQIDGTLTGEFAIRGTVNKPLIRGSGKVANGQIMIDYLKTLYNFTGIIGLTPTSIYFENIQMKDAFNNKGKLEGVIAHRNFNNMRLNIFGSFTNFMVLNTTIKDNELFYGQAFATGEVNFFGPVANLKISATAKTDRNSKIYIPLSSSSSVEKKEFISFVNFNDTTRANTDINNRKKLTGVSIDLNLDITEDAYCEIIFDIKAGDIIRGRGNGDIRLQLDTKGEFSMFGGIVFEEGGYNFTLYNLINKEFDIQKGSRITWSGDPYQGQMNIKAAYNQLASIAPIIIDAENQNDPVLKRKYPLQVLLSLEGAMLSPQINFDIIARDLPQTVTLTNGISKRLAFEFAAFKTKLDEQELKKQVFSLIILRRLSPLNETISTTGSVTNSVSELLSNQLSYWMSQVDENLEIDVDLGALDAEAFNTFQLRLSYTFLNGRLRVTRDGTFTNQNTATAGVNNNSTASLVGDWTVDYLLTADGKFKMRMYNRTNANALLNALNNQNAITTGVSIQHTQSFNTLSDLWRSARERREENTEDPEVNDEAILKEEDGSTEE
jgi:hypothetical protein